MIQLTHSTTESQLLSGDRKYGQVVEKHAAGGLACDTAPFENTDGKQSRKYRAEI